MSHCLHTISVIDLFPFMEKRLPKFQEEIKNILLSTSACQELYSNDYQGTAQNLKRPNKTILVQDV